MKTRTTLLAGMIAFAIPISSFAQHSITGTITNQHSETLPDVKITVEDAYTGAYSDEKGAYTINHLTDGVYTLRFAKTGYETLKKQVTIEGKDVLLSVSIYTSALMIEEVQVAASRADIKTPTTYTNLDKKEINAANFGQDLPYLLNTTPSTVVTSDAGAGVGYTGVRIRGVDPTRTNVTINGIPINDAESHGTYWVNMPDFASSSDNIQVQRGVGTSTNGAAAFGASINIKADNIEKKAYAKIDNSIGSFNTLKTTVKVGTGLINDHFTFDARLSKIGSDGFIDRSSSNLKSLYLSGAWIGKKSLVKVNVFSGKEKTYQAWWGIPEWKYKNNPDSLLTHYYNNGYSAKDSANLFGSNNNTYNYYTYDNETDNYQQDHYQLHFTHTISEKASFNVSGHYTYGRGYYEQYRVQDKFSTYGFEPLIIGSDTITRTDVIRQRWLDNHFYGAIASFNYSNLKNFKLVAGIGANNYEGKHFGEVIWAQFASNSSIRDKYYSNNAQKSEVNGYVKGNYQLGKLNLFADIQARNINYSFVGQDESYGAIVNLKQTVNYTFFNPKAGFMYDFNNQNNAYASFSIANREPTRGDFVEAAASALPKPEQLQDLEVGYRFRCQKLLVNFNYYLMNYKDQLILTGQINDVGAYTRTNVAKSYRTGIELEFAYRLFKKLSVTGNLNLSQNKIVAFDEYVDNYDNYDSDGNMIQDVINHKQTDIAFSPNLIAGLGINYSPIRKLDIILYNKYVGSQFLDNSSSENRQLDGYFTSNLTVNYNIQPKGFALITIGAMVNNLFDAQYVNNGYTYGYVAGGSRIIENFYFPQAGRNFLFRLALTF